MTRILIAFLLALLPTTVAAQTATLDTYYDIQPAGNNTSYMRGLTHRYVGGELRLLTLEHTGVLHEFRLPAPQGRQTATTGRWNLASVMNLADHHGIWYEQAKNRLWVTRAWDYTADYVPAQVTLIALGANGQVTRLKQFELNVPAKRMYGGCEAVPASLVSRLGGPYVCGWGGYTSLTEQGGGAAMGPTMFAIPDPDTIPDGATGVQARTVLDTGLGSQNRGVRKTIPINYFDGGDPRQNPQTPPTGPPAEGARWLSPNGDGLGWFVWGDSYYNNGMWIGTTYAAIASLCKGKCYYMLSNLRSDDKQFELHQWDGAALGSNPLQRPNHMQELVVPRGNAWHSNEGGWPASMTGATYDSVTGRIFTVGYPMGPDVYTGRLYSFTVGAVTTPPPPVPPTPVNCTVSDWGNWGEWSVWTAISATEERRTRTRTRSKLTPEANGGTCVSLVETETETRAIVVAPPPPPPDPEPEPEPAPGVIVAPFTLTLVAETSRVCISKTWFGSCRAHENRPTGRTLITLVTSEATLTGTMPGLPPFASANGDMHITPTVGGRY